MFKLFQLKTILTGHFSVNTLEKYKCLVTSFEEVVGKQNISFIASQREMG